MPILKTTGGPYPTSIYYEVIGDGPAGTTASARRAVSRSRSEPAARDRGRARPAASASTGDEPAPDGWFARLRRRATAAPDRSSAPPPEQVEAAAGAKGRGPPSRSPSPAPRARQPPSSDDDGDDADAEAEDTRPRVVFIMGLGATHGCWDPQVDELLAWGAAAEAEAGARLAAAAAAAAGPGAAAVPTTAPPKPPSRPPMRALLLDNRGVGGSGVPRPGRAYSTAIMARDVLAVMDHIGWSAPVHVVGHSMGAMVATKLAAAAPHRVASLTLISATGGGWDAIPLRPRALYCMAGLALARTPEARADVDLALHFTPATLNQVDRALGRPRRELLRAEYIEQAQGGGVGQASAGLWGQVRAVLTHRVARAEAAALRGGGFPITVLHGRHDLLASRAAGGRLAARLGAAYVEIEGAHFLTRERGPEVNALLAHAIWAAAPRAAAGLDPHRDLAPRATSPAPPVRVAWAAATAAAVAAATAADAADDAAADEDGATTVASSIAGSSPTARRVVPRTSSGLAFAAAAVQRPPGAAAWWGPGSSSVDGGGSGRATPLQHRAGSGRVTPSPHQPPHRSSSASGGGGDAVAGGSTNSLTRLVVGASPPTVVA